MKRCSEQGNNQDTEHHSDECATRGLEIEPWKHNAILREWDEYFKKKNATLGGPKMAFS